MDFAKLSLLSFFQDLSIILLQDFLNCLGGTLGYKTCACLWGICVQTAKHLITVGNAYCVLGRHCCRFLYILINLVLIQSFEVEGSIPILQISILNMKKLSNLLKPVFLTYSNKIQIKASKGASTYVLEGQVLQEPEKYCLQIRKNVSLAFDSLVMVVCLFNPVTYIVGGRRRIIMPVFFSSPNSRK